MTAPSTEPRDGWRALLDETGEIAGCEFVYDTIKGPLTPDPLPPGWTLGPRLDDLMRDATRYLRLRETYRATVRASDGKPGYWSAVESEKCLTAAEFDAEIDAEIAREEGR